MSPELFYPQKFGFEEARRAKSLDCYALEMVIYETINGHLPFHRDGSQTVPMKVLKGERPPRVASFTDSLWRMLERCWKPQPDARPSIEGVLQCLEQEALPPLGPDLETEEGSDDERDLSDDSSCKLLTSAKSHDLCP